MCSQGKPISEGRWAGSAGRGPWWGSGNINRAQLLLLLTRRGRWPGQGGRGGADGPDGAAGPAPRPRPLSRSISHLRLSSDGEPPVDTVPAPPPPGPPGPRGWCRPVLPAPGPVTHVEPERVPTAWLPGASLWGPPSPLPSRGSVCWRGTVDGHGLPSPPCCRLRAPLPASPLLRGTDILGNKSQECRGAPGTWDSIWPGARSHPQACRGAGGRPGSVPPAARRAWGQEAHRTGRFLGAPRKPGG